MQGRSQTGWFFALGGFLAGIATVAVLMLSVGVRKAVQSPEPGFPARSVPKSRETSSSEAAAVSVPPERSIDYENVLDSYGSNQAAAIDWLREAPIAFTGMVGSVTVEGPEETLAVAFGSGKLSDPMVIFDFDEKFRPQVDALYSGEKVRVTGTFSSKGFFNSLKFDGTSIRVLDGSGT